MPQKEIDTGGFEILGLRKAAAEAKKLVNRKARYSVYYSIFSHDVHIVDELDEPDPDWLECESKTPYIMGQQALADCVISKLEDLTRKITHTGGLQSLIDKVSGKL